MSTSAVMTEGYWEEVAVARREKSLRDQVSRRPGRHCLHIFDFYHKVLNQSWLPLERFVAFFCKVLMMATAEILTVNDKRLNEINSLKDFRNN